MRHLIPVFIMLFLFCTDLPAQQQRQWTKPSHTDVKYGPYERNLMDVWLAESDKPTPVLVSIHGGGFRSGNKGIGGGLLSECLKSGISVVAITYRLTDVAIAPAQFHDSARAIQFIRHNAKDWNIDPKRMAATGGSAGAGLSLWLGFHDDLADPDNDDPVLRQSTRLTCMAVYNGQSSYDPRVIRELFPNSRFSAHPALAQLFDVDLTRLDDLPELKYRLFEEVSPLHHLSKDDVPVLLIYAAKMETKLSSYGVAVHHPRFGKMLKVKMDKLKIECELQTGIDKRTDEYTKLTMNFLKKHLTDDRTVAEQNAETPKRKFSKDVFAWFPDGRVRQLSPGDGLYCQPCIHPDGTHVVFWGNSHGCPRIWQADLKTGKIIALTSSETGARHPVYSWDGTQIVFASDRVSLGAHEQIKNVGKGFLPPKNIELNLFVMDVDGKNVRQITTGAHQDNRPCFSPDGKQIVFASNRLVEDRKLNFPFRLWTVSTDGQTAPRLLQKQGWGYRPWYAADGKSIFFFTEIHGRHRICTIPADGGEVTLFAADDQGHSHGPFADPDGKHLLMHSSRGGKWGIWELPLDGGRPRRLSPPGLRKAGHASRAKNGIIAFDGDK